MNIFKNLFFSIVVYVFIMLFFFSVWIVYASNEVSFIGENISILRDIFIEGDVHVEGVIKAYAVPSEVTWTSSTHSGNFGGYKAMNDWIQENGCEGYHVCDADEVTRYQQHHGPVNMPQSWVIGFIYGGGGNYHECDGWVSDSSARHGAIFHGSYGIRGYSLPSWTGCNNLRNVACCKY